MRRSAKALIFDDKKLLLVSGPDTDFYWAPGGGIEDSETLQQALHREIDEELGAQIETATMYTTTVIEEDDIILNYFIVTLKSMELHPNTEVSKTYWYSREDFEKQTINVTWYITDRLIPKLIEDGRF